MVREHGPNASSAVRVINHLPSHTGDTGSPRGNSENDIHKWTCVYFHGLFTQGHEKATYPLGDEFINFHCGITKPMAST